MRLADRLGAMAGVWFRSARLGPRDGLVCLLSWGLLHAAALRLRLGLFVPSRRPAPDRWGPDPAPLETATGGDPAARRLARLLGEAARHPALGLWCLPRALALRQLLRLHGLDGHLALGLRRGPEGLTGHAWVVYHGSVLDQDAAFAGSFVRCEVS